MRFEGRGGEGGRGYIVRTTEQFVYVVLEKDLYKAKQDIVCQKPQSQAHESFHGRRNRGCGLGVDKVWEVE